MVHKVIRFASICEKCITATEHNDDSPAGENSILVNLKEFKAGALCRPPSKPMISFTKLRTKTGSSLMELSNTVDVLEKEAQALSSRFPSCCGVQGRSLKRFIWLRLKIEAKKKPK